MRVALVALTLLAVATPALGHAGHGGNGLALRDLVVTFNPLTQSAEYSFTLVNEPTGATGALYAFVTAHDEVQPRSAQLLDVAGLGSGETKDYTLSVPLFIAINGCIVVEDTGTLHKITGFECSMTRGVSQAPIPDAPPALPPPEPPTLP